MAVVVHQDLETAVAAVAHQDLETGAALEEAGAMAQAAAAVRSAAVVTILRAQAAVTMAFRVRVGMVDSAVQATVQVAVHLATVVEVASVSEAAAAVVHSAAQAALKDSAAGHPDPASKFIISMNRRKHSILMDGKSFSPFDFVFSDLIVRFRFPYIQEFNKKTLNIIVSLK